MRDLSLVVRLALTAVCLLALVGCGEGRSAFAFKSQAFEPRGEPVQMKYALETADSIHLEIGIQGKREIFGDQFNSTDLDGNQALVLTCYRMRDLGDGAFAMRMYLLEPGANAFGNPRRNLQTREDGRMVFSPRGQLKELEFKNAPHVGESNLEQLIAGAGFQVFVPMPAAGMRVGEAIDLSEIISTETIIHRLKLNPPRSESFKPDIQGELVLKRVREIDGEQAAEFGINVVIQIEATAKGKHVTSTFEGSIQVSGTQFNSLRTGLPLGTARVRMELRGLSVAGDKKTRLKYHRDLTIISKMR